MDKLSRKVYQNWWWRGISLWYNDQEYFQAMMAWEEVIRPLGPEEAEHENGCVDEKPPLR